MANKVQKEKAVEFMRVLGIDEKLTNAYRETNKAILFDDGNVGVLLDEKSSDYAKVYAKKIELEQSRDLLVYAILHETFNYGEMYDFLFVSNYPEDWKLSIQSFGEFFRVMAAYAWNVSAEHRSDMGSVFVVNTGNSLIRIL